MELSHYIAFRAYCEVHSFPCRPLNHHYENIFNKLMDFMNLYTIKNNGQIFSRIRGGRTSEDELLIDVLTLFRAIIKELHGESVLTVRTLFVATYYMMIKYKDNRQLSGYIAFWLDAFAYKFSGWRELLDNEMGSKSNSGDTS